MEIFEYLSKIFPPEISLFIVSMIPIIELRGAIPIGHALNINPIVTYIICVLGNMLPVPFILLFIKQILKWMSKSKIKLFNKISNYLIDKAYKRKDKVNKYSLLGLFVFVAIPAPGTGAWTGALIAAVTGMRFKKSFFSILFGVMAAGIIVTIIAYLFFETLGFLL